MTNVLEMDRWNQLTEDLRRATQRNAKLADELRIVRDSPSMVHLAELKERNAKLAAELEEAIGWHDMAEDAILCRDKAEERNAKLVAALEKIAKLEGIATETGRIACKVLVSIPCK